MRQQKNRLGEKRIQETVDTANYNTRRRRLIKGQEDMKRDRERAESRHTHLRTHTHCVR